MTLILLSAIIGFFVGFIFVIKKRKIRPGKLLAATLIGLFVAGAYKIMRDYKKNKRDFNF